MFIRSHLPGFTCGPPSLRSLSLCPVFQDMEISAVELKTIMNKIVAKRELQLRQVEQEVERLQV